MIEGDDVTQRWLVRGRVQGVGFRFFVQREATRLGLRGSVRNTPDGAVEVVAAGTSKALNELEARLHEGPDAAKVTAVEAVPVGISAADTGKTFMITG